MAPLFSSAVEQQQKDTCMNCILVIKLLETGQSHWGKESGEEMQYKSPEELHYRVLYLVQGTGQYME